jgi:hypothetical protein
MAVWEISLNLVKLKKKNSMQASLKPPGFILAFFHAHFSLPSMIFSEFLVILQVI